MKTIDTQRRESAILVGVITPAARRIMVSEYLDELELLADSAGADVEYRVTQERASIDPAHFIGSGKAEELGRLVEEKNIDLVLFDDDLSPVQVRNLERAIKCKIVDRSGIILDIFASRARTREAKTQVELAQLKYMMPRLTRQWTHLSKQYGGIGTKGPGETQIETDRRAIRTRISHLTAKLKDIDKERAVQRKGREKFPRVSLVGYTNAGKSTLLKLLSQADVLVEDRLFATLDATVRVVQLTALHRILLTDTVGFIRKLPHDLVASFRSTLDEVREADILLHIIDVSHPLFEEQIVVVQDTLEEIGAGDKPTIFVFNKIDRLQDRSNLPLLQARYPRSVFISAARGINISSMEEAIVALLDENVIEETITFSQQDHEVISRIHEIAEILEKQYEDDRITIRFRINRLHADRLKKALARSSTDQP